MLPKLLLKAVLPAGIPVFLSLAWWQVRVLLMAPATTILHIYWGPGMFYPIYRPWPCTYGIGAVYNPWTGGWAEDRETRKTLDQSAQARQHRNLGEVHVGGLRKR